MLFPYNRINTGDLVTVGKAGKVVYRVVSVNMTKKGRVVTYDLIRDPRTTFGPRRRQGVPSCLVHPYNTRAKTADLIP